MRAHTAQFDMAGQVGYRIGLSGIDLLAGADQRCRGGERRRAVVGPADEMIDFRPVAPRRSAPLRQMRVGAGQAGPDGPVERVQSAQ
jgi:hypothetical protein